MSASLDSRAKIHVNIMELLVQEEIEKQLKLYPKNLKNYINKVEVATYALNRLPPLYASSAMGKEYQKRTGKKQYQSQINLAVRRALAAIERDPIKQSVPIVLDSSTEYELAKVALNKLEEFLQIQGIIANYQKLSWNNLNRILYPLIIKAKQQQKKRENVEFEALTYGSKKLNQELSENSNSFQFWK
ncbi:hypothetical protein cce_4461 [Crocosphaera subtropica ATCC 51142]|uniref:Late competence development protein ComFB n=1 Tax=Crocosphaera subtropica (strain ATCC 51142 / BH68) TaxID=43989 RepID=B1WUF5_CROS5|nr:late competence development ComFB family protein [Crocosphaera subtropica]ACB53809.1 hypothetical protein cce_4461 [Crocosphaera subtropica ATCC 51142]